jgi:hypothetical protein
MMKLTIAPRPSVEGILAAEDVPIEEEPSLLSQLGPIGTTILNPGMDYQKNILWLTYPGSRMVMKKKSKEKDAPEVPMLELHTLCLNSEGDNFVYEEMELYRRGFRKPASFMVTDEGWNSELPYEFAAGNTKPPDPFDLYMRIRNIYTKYIEFADEVMYDIMASWVMASYVYQVYDSFAYLHFNGTAQSGKSQNLRLLAAFGFNAQWTTNMTAAGMYRGIQSNPGILCIDETESFRDEKGQEIRTILRNGYKKGMDVKRMHANADGTYIQHSFNTYGPKALASINAMDDTTSQRAIVMAMRPAYRDIPYFDQDDHDYHDLKDQLYLFGLNNSNEVRTEWMRWNTEVDRGNIRNRAWEVSGCIVSMAHYIHGEAGSGPIMEWMETYFENQRAQQDANDLIRTLATALPGVLNTIPPRDDWWYQLSDIRDKLTDITDEDVSEKITTRSIQKWLKPLGIQKVRKAHGGKQIQLIEADIRDIITDRRIEPMQEDVAWLAGTEDYQTEAKLAPTATAFAWGSEEDDNAMG